VEFKELLATVKTWPDKGKSLLIRLRGGYWTYRDVPKMLAEYQPRPAVWLTDKESAQLIKDTESTV
jgi:hypothetical protein